MGSGWDGIFTLLSTFAALVVVLVLAYLVLHWMGQKMPTQGSSHHIKVLDRVALGRDKSLLLVRVAEKTVLVGMSTNSVERICEVEDPEALLEVPMAGGQNFSDVLVESLKKGLKNSKHLGGEKGGRQE